jgi:hypothetical protein
MKLNGLQKQYIKKNIHQYSLPNIAERLNVSENEIKEYLKEKWGNERYQRFFDKDTSKNTKVKLLGNTGSIINGIKEFNFKKWIVDNAPYITALVFITFIVFANGLANDFISDDWGAISRNPDLNNFGFVVDHPFTILRPLMYFVTYKLFGLVSWPYRLPNVLFHIAAVITLFWLLTLMSNKIVAFLTSILFAVHPITTEAVTWISGGIYVMYGYFILLSLVGYLLAMKDKKYLYISMISYMAAVSSSEKALAFFPLLILFEFTFFDLKKNWRKLLPYLIVSLIWGSMFGLRISGRQQSLVSANYQTPGLDNPFVQIPSAISSYIQLLFWPDALTLYHTELSFGFLEFSIRLITTLIFFGLILYSYRKNKFIFFWLSFFVITLSPTLTPLKIAWTVAERYVYIGSIGIFFVIAYCVYKLSQQKKLKVMTYSVFIFLILALMIRTVLRNMDWHDQDSLWVATAKYSPSSYFNHNNLGDMYERHGNLPMAEKEFQTAIELNPLYADAWHNLGNVYREWNKPDLALKSYERALQINPNIWQSYQNIAAVLYSQKQLDKAEMFMKKAIQLNPNESAIYSNLAIIYIGEKKYDDAKQMCMKALQINPQNETAKNLLIQLTK